MFCVVMEWVMRDACGLGKETWVIVKVESTGKESALLENGCDVAVGASVYSVDVYGFWGSGCGTSGRRWSGLMGFVDQSWKIETVVGEDVKSVCSVIPLHVVELTKIGQIIDGVASSSKQFGDVGMLRFVLCLQLCGAKV